MSRTRLIPPTAARSRNMAAIRSRDTKPEMYVRRAVHAAGFRYSLHRRDLPGHPDLTFPRYGVAAFVHGCFWHGHDACPDGRFPKTNVSYWRPKIEANRQRDRRNARALRLRGWSVVVARECRLNEDVKRLLRLLERRRSDSRASTHQRGRRTASKDLAPSH
jgi:DNA mismatch endonuclease (patch repair protein)